MKVGTRLWLSGMRRKFEVEFSVDNLKAFRCARINGPICYPVCKTRFASNSSRHSFSHVSIV